MGAQLEALLALREIELQIADIRRQLAAKERSVSRQAERLKAAQGAAEVAKADLRQVQMSADSADVDVKSRDASINKLRDNLNSVRTNKEYAALLTQLNNEKADRSRVETKALELMGEVEQRRASLEEQHRHIEEESRKLATLHTQLEQAQGSFRDRLTMLEKQREDAAARVDSKALDLFNRISERYDGEAMARVIQIHPRRQEFICEGCNIGVTVERASALMSKDEVVTCGSCGRILFVEKK